MKVGVEIESRKFLGREVQDRIPVVTKRVMETHAQAILQEAANIVSDTTEGEGILEQSFDQDTHYIRGGESVESEFLWGSRAAGYGPVMEYGPHVDSWEIEAKWAPALVFPIMDAGGAAIRWAKIPRGQTVTHVWTEDQKRPHFNPAIDKEWPALADELAEVPRRAIEGR